MALDALVDKTTQNYRTGLVELAKVEPVFVALVSLRDAIRRHLETQSDVLHPQDQTALVSPPTTPPLAENADGQKQVALANAVPPPFIESSLVSNQGSSAAAFFAHSTCYTQPTSRNPFRC